MLIETLSLASAVACLLWCRRRVRAAQRAGHWEKECTSLVDSSGDAILAFDEHGQLKLFNAAAQRLFDYSQEEMAKAVFHDLVPGPYRATQGSRTVEAMRKDGTRFLADLTLSPAGEGRIGAILREVDRHRDVAHLAGGVAHEFNNLLTNIRGQVDMLELCEPGPEYKESLGEIRSATLRAAELTRQLLAFSGQQVIEPRPVQLEEWLAGAQAALKTALGPDIGLRWKAARGLPPVMADPAQLTYALVTLASHRREALQGRGEVEITIAGPGEITFWDQGPLPYFDPLALGGIHGILRQMGGRIRFEPSPRKGWVFRIEIGEQGRSGAAAGSAP